MFWRASSSATHRSQPWLITFTDLILLLLAYFVFMFSSLKTDEGKLREALQSFRAYLGDKPTAMQRERIWSATAYLQPSDEAQFTRKSLQPTLLDQGATDRVRTTGQRILFAPGQSSLSEAARQRLRSVAESLRGKLNRIEIRGHATPGETRDVWELSYRRARAVAAALSEFGVESRRLRLSAAGAAEPAVVPDRFSAAKREAADRRVQVLDTGEFVR
jgi:chemotaxis protein MotB